MVAVPPHRARNMQQDLGQRQGDGAELVSDILGRMKVTHVQAEKHLIADRVP